MSLKDSISALIKEKKLDLKRDILPAIEMTEPGYYAMFRNDSIKVSTLKKIAGTLKVPVSAFFRDDSEAKKETKGVNSVVFEFTENDIVNIDMKRKRLEIVHK